MSHRVSHAVPCFHIASNGHLSPLVVPLSPQLPLAPFGRALHDAGTEVIVAWRLFGVGYPSVCRPKRPRPPIWLGIRSNRWRETAWWPSARLHAANPPAWLAWAGRQAKGWAVCMLGLEMLHASAASIHGGIGISKCVCEIYVSG